MRYRGMWEKWNHYKVYHEPENTNISALLHGYLHHDSEVALHAMADYLEENNHPATSIVRSAIGHMQADRTPNWFNHYANETSEGKGTQVVVRPNYHTATFKTPTHTFHFHAFASPQHEDHFHSTGMPQ